MYRRLHQQPEQKDGSLVPIWTRLKNRDIIAPYLRICQSLGVNIEWPATIYPLPVAEPKIRMLTVVKDDPINVRHIKDEIAFYVSRHDINLWQHVDMDALVPLRLTRPVPANIVAKFCGVDINEDPRCFDLYD